MPSENERPAVFIIHFMAQFKLYKRQIHKQNYLLPGKNDMSYLFWNYIKSILFHRFANTQCHGLILVDTRGFFGTQAEFSMHIAMTIGNIRGNL